ncbi:L,D-transpeptidase family protein [Frankia tisae]|uniref:L,D-transpeptidase family protein n=1 Tax=Frankia tisae TaxID=2950104 RepID=UPI0021C030B2|nr:L,D-transpeptidase family protein [Frankia tisae]
MADHRSRPHWIRPRAGSARGRSVAVGIAAVGVTLVVGAASAVHFSGSGGDSRPSASVVVGASGPATRAAGAEPLRPNRVDGADAATGAPGTVPGIGSVMAARIPRDALQVIVASGADREANTNNVTLWQRANPDAPWEPFGAPLTGRNGANGWTFAHREGDLRSPIGVFSLTAAGGKLPDPGTGLPYEYRPAFYRTAAPQGQPMAEAFNYVVAIDYNRLPGRPPSDPTRPMGDQVGGDIWLHVDHKSPTRGCVAVEQDALTSILRWLKPTAHPMIAMGDVADLAADT